MKYLVLGGAGFVGSYLTSVLLEEPGAEVTVFDNLSTGKIAFLASALKSGRVNFVEGTALDFPALSKIVEGKDLVFHLIANADISKGYKETDLDLRLTVMTTYNTLEAMRLAKTGRIVFFSGSGVYGDVGVTPTAENFGPLEPNSTYGASKLAAEAYVSAFSHLYGMKSWIFRFANVVGGRQTHGVAHDFIQRLLKDGKSLTILGDGLQSKSYIHVSDVLSAVQFAIRNSNAAVNVFNVASDDFISVNEIANIVLSHMNLGSTAIGHTGGRQGWPGDVPIVRMDATRIRALGWRPEKSSEQAIRLSVEEMLKIRPWSL